MVNNRKHAQLAGPTAAAATSVAPSPGKATRVQAWPADPPSGAAPVQRKAAADDAPAGAVPSEIAARGVDGDGGELPFRSRIQAAFGHHDISGIRAHQGDAARSASSELGAQAYAFGDAVAFASPPDAHTAAHEGYARRPSIAAATS